MKQASNPSERNRHTNREIHCFPASDGLDLAALIPALGFVPGKDSFVLLEGDGWGASVLAFEPERHLVVEKDTSPFEALREYLAILDGDVHPLEGGSGLFGYLSYDAVRHLERLPARAKDDLKLPISQFILPRYTVGVRDGEAWVSVPSGEDPTDILRTVGSLQRLSVRGSEPGLVARSGMGSGGYERAVRMVKEYIQAGDVFQVNIS
ncbi:MAG: hypothetical protein M3475_07875, partial [Actinomycetota bacterium]|nr:hypothetical protein [Actinomycetota bacterium]